MCFPQDFQVLSQSSASKRDSFPRGFLSICESESMEQSVSSGIVRSVYTVWFDSLFFHVWGRVKRCEGDSEFGVKTFIVMKGFGGNSVVVVPCQIESGRVSQLIY